MLGNYKYNGQPIIFSEYGGIAINSKAGWGYGKQALNNDEFIERLTSLTEIITNIEEITGYCYTQLTDVQQEVNGLMDEKRNCKVEPFVIRDINNVK